MKAVFEGVEQDVVVLVTFNVRVGRDVFVFVDVVVIRSVIVGVTSAYSALRPIDRLWVVRKLEPQAQGPEQRRGMPLRLKP